MKMRVKFGMSMSKGNSGFVYILTDKRYGTLYIGSTDDLVTRIHRHKQGHASQFTTKYAIKQLVWYEKYKTIGEARIKEKQMKKWMRSWKIRLIEEKNSNWSDLYLEAVAAEQCSPPARG